ncbi:RNA polymerase sigma factor [Tropicibacter sp. S64]|uniref:RNA polymerase sigma factor n=1 Tax=Tropicibacter sp. S64 TaxID=3415122 RepID=UPI003C79C916
MTQADPIQDVFRRENRRVFATLVRLLGDFDLAEEALQSAFLAAAERWPREGTPGNPVAWLVSAGRFRAIDHLRRQKRMAPWSAEAEATAEMPDAGPDENIETVEDDRLRLIFTCCHPSLSEEAAVALTLREICGLSTEAIARAFLIAPTTLAQRIVRAKAKIRDAGIPYEVPEKDQLPGRLGRVLRVVYLVFNEGHLASQGEDLLRSDLTCEAIRLARLLAELMPEPEVLGLLALVLLHNARRAARVTAAGDLIPLEDQDRSLWDHAAIAEGAALVRRSLQTGRVGPYAVQAAIAALHGEAESAKATDWAEIAGLYDVLLRIEPSPVIALNRAVAVAMRDGPDAGLSLLEPLLASDRLGGYHLAHAAQADLLRRAGRFGEARSAYETAIALTRQEPERRFLQARLAEIDG